MRAPFDARSTTNFPLDPGSMAAIFPIPALLPLALALVTIFSAAPPASGQTPEATRSDAPYVYLDCNRCDSAHVRQEVDFVNHMRDPDDAQVHILITDQGTGGGGRRYTLAFLGRLEFEGVNNTLTYSTSATDTSAEEREGLTETIKLGLIAYVARTPIAANIDLSVRDLGNGDAAQPVVDRWNSWTFEVYGGGNFNTETSQTRASARYGAAADRVTERWKVRFRPYFNHDMRIIRQEDEPDIRVDLRRHGVNSFLIRSVGPHIGIGLFGDYRTATSDNLNHQFIFNPGVEYSLFPYDEATRRQITFTYRAGYEFADYIEETIYEQTEESLFNSSLGATIRYRQPWGSISSGFTGFTYLHDVEYHRLAMNGSVSVRIGRGVSLNIGGNYQRINDQLGLPRGDASLEDILLQRRGLATDYRGSGSIGLSYTFGSIYANVVNPRF